MCWCNWCYSLVLQLFAWQFSTSSWFSCTVPLPKTLLDYLPSCHHHRAQHLVSVFSLCPPSVLLNHSICAHLPQESDVLWTKLTRLKTAERKKLKPSSSADLSLFHSLVLFLSCYQSFPTLFSASLFLSFILFVTLTLSLTSRRRLMTFKADSPSYSRALCQNYICLDTM